MTNALHAFECFLRENGLTPDLIEADSQKRRCATATPVTTISRRAAQ